MARPTDYTEELGEEICLKVATHGKGLHRLCKDYPHWPCHQTIYEWRIKNRTFGDKYTKAKQDQIELLVDEMLDIADDTSNDNLVRIDKDGNEYSMCNSEYVNRSRLRLDTRKWIASKLAPKIYGEKTQTTIDATLRQEDAIKELE